MESRWDFSNMSKICQLCFGMLALCCAVCPFTVSSAMNCLVLRRCKWVASGNSSVIRYSWPSLKLWLCLLALLFPVHPVAWSWWKRFWTRSEFYSAGESMFMVAALIMDLTRMLLAVSYEEQRIDKLELHMCDHQCSKSTALFSLATSMRTTWRSNCCHRKLGQLLWKPELMLLLVVLFGNLFNL